MSLIKLEVAMDYPIQWEFSRVFRDLIQNFYDSLTPEEFSQKFRYHFELEDNRYHVWMETVGIEFSYEWLIYVGGSTKTDKAGKYIGKYGEGFKMSALRIMQMGAMKLTMHSQDWIISPVTYSETIDEKEIPMLGYEYKKVLKDGITRLEITGINKKHKVILEEALLDFCYPENELFGPLIRKGAEWELYKRSEKEIPCRQNLPNLKGILYINNLARGRLDLPVIINYKTEIIYDLRSRETLDDVRTIESLYEVARKFDAKTSLFVLELLRKNWNDYPKNANDVNTKYYLVCQLVRNIVQDKAMASAFKRKYKELVYIERKSTDPIYNKLIDETKAWSRNNNSRQIVNPIFRLLGADSLVSEYQKIQNSKYKKPSKIESLRADILYTAVNSIVPIVLTDKMPEIIIDEVENGKFNALQFATKNYAKVKGKKKRYEIIKLAFTHEDFYDEAYFDTLLKMAEALLHVYGTDRSRTVTALLTHLGQWMLEGEETIKAYEVKWKEVRSTTK